MKLKLALLITAVLPLFALPAHAQEIDEMTGEAIEMLPDCSTGRIKSMVSQLNRTEKMIKKIVKKEQAPAYLVDAFRSNDKQLHLGLETQKSYMKAHYLSLNSIALENLVFPIVENSTPSGNNERQVQAITSAMTGMLQKVISDRNQDSKENSERQVLYDAALKAVSEAQIQTIAGLKDLISHSCEQFDRSEEPGQDDL